MTNNDINRDSEAATPTEHAVLVKIGLRLRLAVAVSPKQASRRRSIFAHHLLLPRDRGGEAMLKNSSYSIVFAKAFLAVVRQPIIH